MNKKVNLIFVILALILLTISLFGGLASETANLISFSAIVLMAVFFIYSAIRQISKHKGTSIIMIVLWLIVVILHTITFFI